MENDTPAVNDGAGRVIRAALIIFPVGTVILGIASFGVWWVKKEAKEEREAKYVRALRRELNAPEIQQYANVLKDVLVQPEAQRLPAVVSYLNSSMGPENMGYTVRRERYYSGPLEVANVDVELEGKQRAHQVVAVLGLYGDATQLQSECHALAELMALAHSMVGENKNLTLRFAGLPVGIKDLDGQTALERFAASCRSRDERLMQVFVLGGRSAAEIEEIRQVLRADQQGTIVQPLPATSDVPATLEAAKALQLLLRAAIDRQ